MIADLLHWNRCRVQGI
ncbi:hypothetical protein pipiens_006216, partial [Culex pipiens pipiens]